jgi:hypothetical protein
VIAETIALHNPSRWRSFTNDNEILSCCGHDFGNATKRAKRGDNEQAWKDWAEHVAKAALETLIADVDTEDEIHLDKHGESSDRLATVRAWLRASLNANNANANADVRPGVRVRDEAERG